MSDQNENLTNEMVQNKLSPVIKENKLLGDDKDVNDSSNVGQSEIVTLVDEGNGVYSVEQGTEARTDQHVKEMETRNTFGRGEEGVDSSVQKMCGGGRECLTKETYSGESVTIIVSSTSNLRIFTNPKATRSLLENSIFKEYMLGPVEVKGKGKSVKIEVKFNMGQDIEF